MQLTEVLSYWGSILATILGVLRFLEFLEHRAGLKVAVESYRRENLDVEPPQIISLVSVTVVNTGGTPITIKEVGFLVPGSIRLSIGNKSEPPFSFFKVW